MKARLWSAAIAVAVCILAMVLRFPGALPGDRVVSAHDHLTVHPLFQEDGQTGRVVHPHLSDPALQLAALDRRTVAALRRGEAPLWNPDIYLGAPLLGDAQSRPLSPVTLLRVPHWSASVAQDLGVAWLLLWSGLGWGLVAGRLSRRQDSRMLVVATAAAVGVTAPFLSVWLLHPHASTVVWLPWGLLALERRLGAGLALATVGLLTGGHPGTMVHVAGIWLVWWSLRSRRLKPAVGLVVGCLLAAPIWLPVVEQAARSTTLAARVGGVLELRQLLDLLWPGVLGHPVTETWHGSGAWADGQLHPGLVALALALVALGHPQTRRGPSGWVWGIVLLCGVGSVWGLPGPIAHGRLLSLSLGLMAIPASAVVAWLPGGRWRWALPALVLVTGTHARWHDQNTVEPDVHEAEPAGWADPMRAAAAGGRIVGVDWAVQPNTGALAGLRDVRGYDLPVSTDTQRLMEALNPRPRGPWYPVDVPPSPALRRWLGLRVVTAFPQQAEAVVQGVSGWSAIALDETAPLVAYADPDPPPMAWLSMGATKAPSAHRSLQLAVRSELGPQAVPVEGTVDAIGQPAGMKAAQRVDIGGSVIELAFEPQSDAAVAVLSEAWAPGWRARLSDGSPVAVVRVAGLLLGAPVPAGVDGVRFYYRPDGWIIGQRLFGVGLILLILKIGLLIWSRRFPRQR